MALMRPLFTSTVALLIICSLVIGTTVTLTKATSAAVVGGWAEIATAGKHSTMSNRCMGSLWM